MIERAIILKIQKEQPNVQLFIKLILMINRIYYPQMIAITVFSSTLLLLRCEPGHRRHCKTDRY